MKLNEIQKKSEEKEIGECQRLLAIVAEALIQLINSSITHLSGVGIQNSEVILLFNYFCSF